MAVIVGNYVKTCTIHQQQQVCLFLMLKHFTQVKVNKNLKEDFLIQYCIATLMLHCSRKFNRMLCIRVDVPRISGVTV